MRFNKPFIVAEMSGNHCGNLSTAHRIIEAAHYAGADAVKLQTFEPEQMVGDVYFTVDHGLWSGYKLIDLYKKTYIPKSWHKELFEHAHELGLVCFSTPFHPDDVEFLETLRCPIYKIASFEIVDKELIQACGRTKQPIIISTGMAEKHEIEDAVRWSRESGAESVTLLKCTSAYPAQPKDANLYTLLDFDWMADNTGVSDHSKSNAIPVMSVAMGGMVIEKHLRLPGRNSPDEEFSLTPEEFKSMVQEVNEAFESLGDIHYGAGSSERANTEFRRSLWFAKELNEGEVITREHIKSARPSYGLPPAMLEEVIGKKTTKAIKANTPITRESIKWDQQG